MPVESKTKKELAPTSFGTYGAQGAVTWLPVVQITRTRNWSNSGFRTPAQRAQALLTNGYLPTHAYTDDLQHIVNSKLVTITGLWSASDPKSTILWRFIPTVPRITVSTADSDASLVKAQALDALQGKLSGVGVSVPLTILEAGKTATMIGDAASRIFKSYRHLKHGNFHAAALALNLKQTPRRVGRHRTLEENWLEYRYGWRLVVYDITSYMKQIHNMLTTKPIVHRVTTRKESVVGWRGSWTETKAAPVPDLAIRYEVNRVESKTITVDAGYVYALESVPLSLGQELGLLNPALVAWDFLPASFMLDWAANVSSVLEGLTAFQGKKFLDGWTCVAVHTSRYDYWTDIRNGYGFARVDPSSFFSNPVEERRFSRQPLGSFQPASLRVDFSASFKNGIDGLALIKQVFGPSRR